MKKLICALLLTATGMKSQAQEVYHAYQSGTGVYIHFLRRWIYYDPHPTDLTFILQQNVLIVNDKKASTYILGDECTNISKEKAGALGWYAVDQDGKSCVVVLFFYREGPVSVQINCIYGEDCFYYNAKRVRR
jgi:hypothetical protein